MANLFRPSTWIRRRDLETAEPQGRARGATTGGGEVATTALRRPDAEGAVEAEAALGLPVRERIEQRAYEIWSAEGCPRGRDMEIWLAAEREILDRVQAGRVD